MRRSKPNAVLLVVILYCPEPVYELCRHAGVLPSECLVVGETSNDTQIMGVRGGAGYVVGVLTGSGTKDQLLNTGANIVLPNIGYLEKLLLLSSKSVGLVIFDNYPLVM